MAQTTSETTSDFEIDRQDLSGRIYHALRRQILSGNLAPGSRLSLEEYAQHFRVSITPVRDALRLLAADGLVQLHTRRGAYVTMPSPAAVEELYQIREIIECAATDAVVQKGSQLLGELRNILQEIAAGNIGETHADYLSYVELDNRFHQSLVDSMENTKLSEIYAGLHCHTLVTHALYTAPDQRASGTLSEHETIVAALERRDVHAAREALRLHLQNAKREILQRIPPVAE